jgi:hypothetical protein
MRRLGVSLVAVLALLAAASDAHAEGHPSVVVWPTLTPAGDAPSAIPLHAPAAAAEKVLTQRAQELDATLRDGVQDLGFTLFVADSGPSPGHTRDEDLVQRASQAGSGGASNAGTWVVSPRIEQAADGFVVRIVAVPPNGHELRVRVDTVTGDDVAVRGLVMLRDLLAPTTAEQAAIEREQREHLDKSAEQGMMSPLRSQGRAVLAINAGLFGGFVGYSVEAASGNDDPRVLYPLMALGAGVGIGSALLVADEWDVTTGDAWLLSTSAAWGAVSGFFIADGLHVAPFSDRYAWGTAGGFIGLGLSTLVLAKTKMDEGDAMLGASGGALGLFFGALGELAYRGSTTDATPYTGMGYGAAIGLVAAGAIATRVTTTPSRVLLVDLGVGLGALAGAAVASPLIFQDVSADKTRGWLAATLGGSLAGGALAWYLTRDSWKAKDVGSMWRWGTPGAGVVGASETRAGVVPAYGVYWRGSF